MNVFYVKNQHKAAKICKVVVVWNFLSIVGWWAELCEKLKILDLVL